MHSLERCRKHGRRRAGLLVGVLLCVAAASAAAQAPRPGSPPPPLPPVVTAAAAVDWALQFNPALMTVRRRHQIAEAGVVIAQIYPYNPILQNQLQYCNGPPSAGNTFYAPFQSGFMWQVQIRGQRGYRVQYARATLARTDWEIAYQEQLVAVNAVRAFRGLLYRQEKLRLFEEMVRINEEAYAAVKALTEKGKLGTSDLILARAQVSSYRSQLGLGRDARLQALYALRQALGTTQEDIAVSGTLEPEGQSCTDEVLAEAALARRGDYQAARVAVDEAAANVRYTIANRFGNPSVGPLVNMDNSRSYFIGGSFNIPLPIFNSSQGNILQTRAVQAQTVVALRQKEIEVRQAVQVAVGRLRNARAWVMSYQKEILPNLEADLQAIDKLLRSGEPKVRVLDVISVRRRLLQARSDYLDALWTLNQAQADLAAAVGDPMLALVPCVPLDAPRPRPLATLGPPF